MKDKPAKKWYRRLINAMVGVITLILLCHENTLRADRTTAESYVYNGNVSYLNANDYRTAERPNAAPSRPPGPAAAPRASQSRIARPA